MPTEEQASRATVSLDRDLWRKAKIQAAREDRTVGEMIDEAVRELLRGRVTR